MTDEEKFRFDLQGFLVVGGILSPEECEALSRQADEQWPRSSDDGLFRRTADISRWGPNFLNLMDHPRILPYLFELIGPGVRADHDYCIFMQQGAEGQNLHGGPMLHETDHWYHYKDGVIRNGLTVVTWTLTDANPGEGGFTCLPGNHMTNFLKHFPKDVASQQRVPDFVHQPTLRAGDVLIFTEALIHGTATWRAATERRALLYKYSPPHSSWAKVPYSPDAYPSASEQQRRLMQPPSVAGHLGMLDEGL